MIRNEAGNVFHIEEQRNLGKSDMYRFASYHRWNRFALSDFLKPLTTNDTNDTNKTSGSLREENRIAPCDLKQDFELNGHSFLAILYYQVFAGRSENSPCFLHTI